MMRSTAALLLLLVVSVASRAGRGAQASQRLGYEGVMACFFELADLNHDAQLSEIEMNTVLGRWVSRTEQVMDLLTAHRILVACDTDNSRQVSWHEITEVPRCLTLSQTEGIAKWVCSRARHGDFSFSEYVQLQDTIQAGMFSGNTVTGIQAGLRALHESQTAARQAALARELNTERLSPEVNSLITGLGSVSQIAAIPIAGVIVVMALLVACCV